MIYAKNSKANHKYTIKEKLVVGLSLSGKQAQLIRSGHAIVLNTYVVANTHKNILTLINVQLGDQNESIPLLVNSDEKKQLIQAIETKGTTVIGLEIKPIRRWIKAVLGIAVGKKIYNRKQEYKERDLKRLEQKNLL